MPTPGLMLVVSRPLDPSKTPPDLFNRFYNEELVPKVLEHGVVKVALRYRNADPKLATQYVALYPIDDVSYLGSEENKKLIDETRKSKVLGVQDIYELVESGLCPYKKIQTFEGVGYENASRPERGQTVVAVAMQPGEGQEQDFEDWYRKQHLDMLSMCKGYLRCTRYQRTDGQKPMYLALHEYTCKASEMPVDQLKIVINTEWSKKILAESPIFDRNVFELINTQGDLKLRL